MTSLQEQFEAAGKHFQGIYATCSNKQQLRMYALYNQVANGDVDLTTQPSSFQITKSAKFEARKRCIGMPKELAMKRYISELRGIDPDWGNGGASAAAVEGPGGVRASSKKALAKTASLFKRRSIPRAGGKARNTKTLQKQFEKAANYAKNSQLFNNSNSRSLLYSYYKQATEGPCTGGAPRTFSRARYAQWQAWANLYDMPKEEAMSRYVEHVQRFAPDFETSTEMPEALREILAEEEDLESKRSSGESLGGLELTSSLLKKILNNTAINGGLVYLVTGATGFLGTFLLEQLLKRNPASSIFCLTRASSKGRLHTMAKTRFGMDGAERVFALTGDVSAKNLGIDKKLLEVFLTHKTGVDHFFHLAASYDMNASDEVNEKANVLGTKYAIELANELSAACGTVFQYTSSIVVAGMFQGMFLEDNLVEGQEFDNPYARTKYEAEVMVREKCKATYRIYRPGVVVGHSQTGEAFKIDGPYFFFKPIQQLRKYCPSSVTLPCIEGGTMPVVPVDYVVQAMDHLAHKEDKSLDGKAFHLVDSSPPTLLEVMNILSKAAHGPQFSSRIATFASALIPKRMLNGLMDIPVIGNAPGFFAQNVFEIPEALVKYVSNACEWDDSETREALIGSGIRCRPFGEYAWRLWDYYERFMDRSLDKKKALVDEIKNKTVLITGASDGIGKRLASRLAASQAHVIIVARNKDKLDAVKKEMVAEGGSVSTYVADLSDEASTNKMVKKVLKDHGHIHYLINNAGRSIRRSVEYQCDPSRFHDFQRTIDLNYYGSLRCILGFLPSMREQKNGHIINISSIGCLTNAPRFSAYVASKAALDAFSGILANEVSTQGIKVTTVYMPLVATKMVVSPGNKYDHMNLLSVDEASALIERAIVTKERRIDTPTGHYMRVANFLFPSLTESVLNRLYLMEPEKAPHGQKDSPSANGDKEQLKAVRNLLRGAI